MKTMYREEMSRRRLPAILSGFLFLALVIRVTDKVRQDTGNNRSYNLIITMAAIATMIIFAAVSLARCRTRLRYSIIADQLIIHKINNQEQLVARNVKIGCIQKIERTSALGYFINFLKHGRYLCSIFYSDIYCCSYLDNGKVRKFFFQPSQNLVSKLKGVCLADNDKLVS